MAFGNSFVVGRYALDLGGKFAGTLQSCEIGAIGADVCETASASDYITKKTIGNLEYKPFSAKVSMAQCAPQLSWIGSIWEKNVQSQSGRVILANHNFEEVRAAEFEDALITEVALTDLDASAGKTPLCIDYKFQPERVKYVSGTGAKLKSDMAPHKAFSPANFSCTLGGLPCERVTKISGMKITSELAKEPHGAFRQALQYCANVKFPEVSLTISGDPKAFTEWNKWATSVLQDGVCTEDEELDLQITLLDQTLKKPLATMTWIGCTLKEFSFGDKMEFNKAGLATFKVTLLTEDFRGLTEIK
jgi:hypothetical protein